MVNDAVAGRKLGFARDVADCDSFPDPCFLTPLEECLFSTSELAADRKSACSQPPSSRHDRKSVCSQHPIF